MRHVPKINEINYLKEATLLPTVQNARLKP